jgi:Mlc titration factor MtfA (ptsG expression regulator)
MYLVLIIAVLFAILVSIALSHLARIRKRKKLFSTPLPERWLGVIHRNVSLYRRLPDELKRELAGHIQVFLREKNFEGCGGLVLTDEIKVTIAAEACLLLLNRKTKYFPMADSVLVYPHAYFAKRQSELGFNMEEDDERLGESSIRGAVVLAWDHVKMQAVSERSSMNVVLHEFAHQLDEEDGTSDGVPVLKHWRDYKEWGLVLGREYDDLVDKADKRIPDVLDHYGAMNPAEFFAVATEAFFERPQALRQRRTELYEQLKKFYELDPAEWTTQNI